MFDLFCACDVMNVLSVKKMKNWKKRQKKDKYLLNNVNLKIKLRRSRDAIALMADTAEYKIKIKEMALYVRKVKLSPAVIMGDMKALEKTSGKYPVRKVCILMFYVI